MHRTKTAEKDFHTEKIVRLFGYIFRLLKMMIPKTNAAAI